MNWWKIAAAAFALYGIYLIRIALSFFTYLAIALPSIIIYFTVASTCFIMSFLLWRQLKIGLYAASAVTAMLLYYFVRSLMADIQRSFERMSLVSITRAGSLEVELFPAFILFFLLLMVFLTQKKRKILSLAAG